MCGVECSLGVLWFFGGSLGGVKGLKDLVPRTILPEFQN